MAAKSHGIKQAFLHIGPCARYLRALAVLCAAAWLAACSRDHTDASNDGFSFLTPRTQWAHLDAQTRRAIDESWGLWEGRVVIHSTGFDGPASLADLQDYHTRVLGLEEGLAYHFVIGGGQGMRAGRIVAGPRWAGGIPCAALRDPELAAGRISIALAGEFSDAPPVRAQLEALAELLDYLTAKAGRLDVRLHRELEPCPRKCPGPHFPEDLLREAYPAM